MKTDTILLIAGALALIYVVNKVSASNNGGSGVITDVTRTMSKDTGNAIASIPVSYFEGAMNAGGYLYDITLKPTILGIKAWGDPNSFWS